jgi:PAS domain-containing protein
VEDGMEAGMKEMMRLLNVVDEGVYFTDKERRITFWNKAAERIACERDRRHRCGAAAARCAGACAPWPGP